MARGLKISHERDDGTLVDQRVFGSSVSNNGSGSTVIGATGGRPQWITVQGVKTVKVEYRDANGVLHANAYVVSQRGSKRFFVANAVSAVENHTHSNASATTCTLTAGSDAANGTPSSGAAVCSIVGYDTSNTAFYASRISNKYVWDQNNVRYRYRTSDYPATATYANVICH